MKWRGNPSTIKFVLTSIHHQSMQQAWLHPQLPIMRNMGYYDDGILLIAFCIIQKKMCIGYRMSMRIEGWNKRRIRLILPPHASTEGINTAKCIIIET